MYAPVTIMLNEGPSNFEGFDERSNVMVRAFTYMADIQPDATGNVYDGLLQEADRAYRLFNATPGMFADEENELVQQYRALRLRSMSTGDVVMFPTVFDAYGGQSTFAVDRHASWERIQVWQLHFGPDPWQPFTSPDAEGARYAARRK